MPPYWPTIWRVRKPTRCWSFGFELEERYSPFLTGIFCRQLNKIQHPRPCHHGPAAARMLTKLRSLRKHDQIIRIFLRLRYVIILASVLYSYRLLYVSRYRPGDAIRRPQLHSLPAYGWPTICRDQVAVRFLTSPSNLYDFQLPTTRIARKSTR